MVLSDNDMDSSNSWWQVKQTREVKQAGVAPSCMNGPTIEAGAETSALMPGTVERQQLVEQARMHGVRDHDVLAAIGRVPRELFVPEGFVESAFDDGPLPIGEGQTISQPAMVALMAEAASIRADDSVLEIGSGSGYGAAVLRALAGRVTTVERLPVLAERARKALDHCGFCDVDVVVGDGTLGWPDKAPYDAIIVTAAGPSAPPPLLEQLSESGRLVMPVGSEHSRQQLMRFTLQHSNSNKNAGRKWSGKRASKGAPRHSESSLKELNVCEEQLMPVRFVPLLGVHGF